MKSDKSACCSSIHQMSLQHLLNTWHLTSCWGNISKQEQIELDQARHASKQTNEKDYPLHHSHKRQTTHKLMTFLSLCFVSDVLDLHLARAHSEFHSQSFLQTEFSSKIDGEECPFVGQN